MNRTFLIAIIFLAVILGGVFLFSVRAPQRENESGKINVVASFYPLAYLATAIGGDLVSVTNLVPAGTEPHDFEPSPRQLADIGWADIFFYNGAGFEPWVKKWEQSVTMRPRQMINMADTLKEKGADFIIENEAINPHFWLDPTMFGKEAEIVRDALAVADPAHEAVFRENMDHLITVLAELDHDFRVGLSSCALRDIIVLHEAFTYLARAYDFSAVAIAGISPEEEPSPKELARIITLALAKGVKHIFSEMVASPKLSETVAREIGGSVLVLNPIESMTPDEVQLGQDYISAMILNLNNLRAAMLCNHQ